DVDPEQVKSLVAAAVAAPPTAGAGPPGKGGIYGRDGADAHAEDGQCAVLKAVAEAVAAIPPAEAGQDGAPGRDGRDGQSGPAGPAGREGVDGKDGLPGRDGFSAEDMTATTPDDGRTIVITLARGGEVISQN